MANCSLINIVLLSTAVFVTGVAQARPEYAAQAHVVNCAACHVNPSGGGARNLYGKTFEARDFRGGWLSKQDIFSLDVRGQDYFENRVKDVNSQAKGQMLMEVAPTVRVPLAPTLNTPNANQLVLSYNFAPVGNAFREAYYLVPLAPVAETAWWSNLLFGNFMAPFGLATDEHRTYTRQMTAMTDREFESGVMATGDPSYKVHYDLALTSGFANGGVGTNSHADSYGFFANVRHELGSLPAHLGLSYSQENTTDSNYALTATSLYGVFSFDKYTGPSFQGNIQAEMVWAHGWDNSAYATPAGDGIGYFIPATASAWQTALTDASSTGFQALFNWDLNRHWTLQFKHEDFTPDTHFAGDAFHRNGIGFKNYFTANADILFRYDYGYVTRPGLTSADLAGSRAVGATYFAMLHVWL